MDQNLFSAMSENLRKMYAPVVELNKVIIKNTERLTEHSLNTMKNYADLGIEQLRAWSSIEDAKSASEVNAKQSKIASELSKQMMKDAQKLVELGQQMQHDIVAVLGEAAQKSTHTMQEQMQTTTHAIQEQMQKATQTMQDQIKNVTRPTQGDDAQTQAKPAGPTAAKSEKGEK